MYARDPEQITPTNVGLSMAGLLPFVPSAAGVVVHHGTPHRWMSEPEFPEGRPRMDKIGTGEGAQAYGHGIYFAENPKVATDYREKLSERPTVKLDGKPYEELPPPGTPGGIALHALVSDRAGKFGDVKGTLDYLEKVSEMGTGDSPTIRRARKRYRDAYAWLEKQAPRLTVEKPGTLYELDLPDDIVPRMLDWDAPPMQSQALQDLARREKELEARSKKLLSAASKLEEGPTDAEVNDALFNVLTGQADDDWEKHLFGLGNPVADEIRDRAAQKVREADEIRSKLSRLSNYWEGKDLMYDTMRAGYRAPDRAHAMAAQDAIANGQDPVAVLKSAYPGIEADEITAALPPMWELQQMGIPGVKYLDGLSRRTGEGTHNYVVWDQDLLNNMPILGVK
jgi:hypothetical protein